MSSRSKLRQMTKDELKSWLTEKNERLPSDDRLKDYYLDRALNTFERLQLSDEEEEDDNVNNNGNISSPNSPFMNAIRKRRQSIQDGFSSGASGGSSNSRKKAVSRRSRRSSGNNSVSSVTSSGKRIVKTRRKTAIKKTNSKEKSSSKENRGNENVSTQYKNNVNSNSGGAGAGAGAGGSGGSRSKRVASRVKTQHKDSPNKQNAIKRTRNRMRRATDNPATLQDNRNRYDNNEIESDDDDDNDSPSNNNNNNNKQYFIDREAKSMTIMELKQWLTSHNIEYSGNAERKSYYVNLVSQYSKSRDDTFDQNQFNAKNENRNIVKRGLSPKYKHSHASPNKRVKKQSENDKGFADSPPLPANLDPSPLTPPDLKKLKQSPIKHKENNDHGDDDDDDDDMIASPARRKHGLLKTPALLKKNVPAVTDSSRAAMRDEIKKMLESSDNDGNEVHGDEYDDNEEDEDDDNDNDNENDDNDVLDDYTNEKTRQNTLLNQYLSSKYYNDKLKKEKKRKLKKEQKEKERQRQMQLEKEKEKENGKQQLSNDNNNNNNNYQSNYRSPFAVFGKIMNRFSPSINRFGRNYPFARNNNNSNNNNMVSGAPHTNVNQVKHRLNLNSDDEEMDAMSPYPNITHNNNNNGNNNNNNNNNNRRGINSSEQAYLRKDEENIPTDPDSPSPPPMSYIGGKKKKIIKQRKGKHNIQHLTKNVKVNDVKHNQMKSNQLPPNYIKTDNDNNTTNNKNNSNMSGVNDKNKKSSICGTILSVIVALVGIMIAFVLSGIFYDSLKQQTWNMSQEFDWFCDNGTNSVNGRLFSEVNGKRCYPCPSEHSQFCRNGHAFCDAHYRVSGKQCVLDNDIVRMAHEIELKARQILSQYKGRAECGEAIEPGLLENQLKAHTLAMIHNKKEDELESGWKYFISYVMQDSIDIEFNRENKRYYSIISHKTFICELKHFLIENIFMCILTFCIIVFILYWMYQYSEKKHCFKMAKLMREYTFEILKEQKLKTPSFKAVSQIKQDNMTKFGSLIGKNIKKREKIWHIVKDRFERDAYIQCSQRTVDGMQKLCWQLSDTYLKKPSNNGIIGSSSSNNNNNIGDKHNNNVVNHRSNNNNEVGSDHNNNNNNSILSSDSYKPSVAFVDNTPMTTKALSSAALTAVVGGGMQARRPQSPSNVYGVPINQQQRHSVTSPSRSFGMTPVIPRNQGMNLDHNTMEMPHHSKYNPWA